MAQGPPGTPIAARTVRVARSIGVTVLSPALAVYAVLPSGVIAIEFGFCPTLIGVPRAPVATSIGVTVQAS
jgi:hypothetical protein